MYLATLDATPGLVGRAAFLLVGFRLRMHDFRMRFQAAGGKMWRPTAKHDPEKNWKARSVVDTALPVQSG